MSKIEWTETTWNPVTGCTKISAGCKNCYAERMAHRIQSMGLRKYQNGFQVTMHPSTLDDPLKWQKPRLVFVNSMSDLFHEKVNAEFVQRVFQTMNRAKQHTFQVLTKRPRRALDLGSRLTWSANIWLGVSIESNKVLDRLDLLRRSRAKIKFLSLEPLLGPLPSIDLDGVDWVIVGGESGPRARPMQREWVLDIRDHCIATSTPFFFKQWGGKVKKRTGRMIGGRTWDEMPTGYQSMASE